MKCLHCGAEMHESDLYCANCGTKNEIPSPTEERNPDEIFPTAYKIRKATRKITFVIAIIVAIFKILGKI
jgi:uncharacterized membrane protein YvbJ